MPKLFIRLQSPAVTTDEGYSVQSAWMIQEDDGRTRARGETDFRGLADLIDPGSTWLQNPLNVIVTVPAEHVLSLSCDVPGRSVGQIRRALPFVVEEFVTTDIDTMHLANGELKRGAPARVVLIERQLLEDWLACLAALEINPGYLFSDAELLPAADRQVSLLVDDDRALIRTPDQAAAVDRENLPLALGALDVDRAQVVFGTLTDLERGQLAPELDIETVETPGADTVLGYVAAHWRTAEAVNLLQGGFRPRLKRNPTWERWRSVAALLAVWIGVALVSMTAQALYASYRADDLEARSEGLYRDLFPKERRVTNPRRQLQAKLGERPDGPSTGFIAYLAPLSAAMSPATRIQSLSYTEDRAELAVDLMVSGFDDLDRFKERLGSEGVDVEITSAEQVDDSVRARVRLRGAPGADA